MEITIQCAAREQMQPAPELRALDGGIPEAFREAPELWRFIQEHDRHHPGYLQEVLERLRGERDS